MFKANQLVLSVLLQAIVVTCFPEYYGFEQYDPDAWHNADNYSMTANFQYIVRA